jgi:hypothetical protein
VRKSNCFYLKSSRLIKQSADLFGRTPVSLPKKALGPQLDSLINCDVDYSADTMTSIAASAGNSHTSIAWQRP